MTKTLGFLGAAALMSALAGCVVDDTGGSAAPTVGPAEQACLRAVTQVTNNPDVVLLSSSFSQAGTEVIAGVGPQRARWQCIGYSNGTTSTPQSLTDEGSL